MKNDTFFHNVNPKVAQTVMRSHPKSKTINEEMLQLISRVRLLQDNLLEEQYRHEMLLTNNNESKQRLNVLRMKNEAQQDYLKKLDQEMELHKIKNKELHICEESLKILEKQIYELNESADRKEDQCEQLKRESERIRLENMELFNRNKEAYEKSVYTNAVIQDFLSLRVISYHEDQPVDFLRVKLQNLRQILQQIESKQAQLRKEQVQLLTVQKQKTIRLQFQQQLLTQRENDDSKMKAISDMCQNQQNLQKVVEEMLVKEDELVQEIKASKQLYESAEKQVGEDLRKIEQSWDEERQSLYRQQRQLKMVKERLMYQAVDWQIRTKDLKQKYAYRSQEQQMILRMNGELQLMKKLRQAQQRNNYLKLKIKQTNQIKGMMVKEKDIIRNRRFSY